jgi:hypothetical protein
MDSEKKSKTKAPKKSKTKEPNVIEPKVTELKVETKKTKTKEPKVIEPKVIEPNVETKKTKTKEPTKSESKEFKAHNNGTKRKNKVGVNKPSKSKKNNLSVIPEEPIPKARLELKAKSEKVKVEKAKPSGKTIRIKEIIDKFFKDRLSKNNFEDLFRLEGLGLTRPQYKRPKGTKF